MTHLPRFTVEMLDAFGDAWNRHDIDAIMSFMADDCVFEASSGQDVCGARYQGRTAVRAAFEAVWTTIPDARWRNARSFVAGERGVSEWLFTGTTPDGGCIEADGLDLFTFRGDRILVKNAFRKDQRAPSQVR